MGQVSLPHGCRREYANRFDDQGIDTLESEPNLIEHPCLDAFLLVECFLLLGLLRRQQMVTLLVLLLLFLLMLLVMFLFLLRW